MGKQQDGSWALGPNIQLSNAGKIIDATEQRYVWIGYLYSGPEVTPACEACSIELPLSIIPLNVMLVQLRQIMSQNFMPCMFANPGFSHNGSPLSNDAQRVKTSNQFFCQYSTVLCKNKLIQIACESISNTVATVSKHDGMDCGWINVMIMSTSESNKK